MQLICVGMSVACVCRLEVKPQGGADQPVIPIAELVKLAEGKAAPLPLVTAASSKAAAAASAAAK